MTLAEFKAWFEGYTEGLEAAPTKAQFDRIKEKVKLIDGAPITQTVYIRDYLRPYYPYPVWSQPYFNGAVSATGRYEAANAANYKAAMATAQYNAAFNSTDAMYALGKAEAAN